MKPADKLTSDLLKLCGMAYCGGKYTADEWQAKVGVHPSAVGRYVKIWGNGLCSWTPAAEAICEAHFQSVRNLGAQMGVRHA